MLFSLGKQEEQYYIVLENVHDYTSIKLQQEVIKLAQSFDMELYVSNTFNYNDSKPIINSALSNKLPVITYQGETHKNLFQTFNLAKDKIILSRNKYFSSFLLLTTPLPEDTQLPLPWSFVGFDTKKMAQTIFKKISNKISDVSFIVVYSPKTQQNCNFPENNSKLEYNLENNVNTNPQTTSDTTSDTTHSKKNAVPSTISLPYSVFTHLKKIHSKTENVTIPCYNRIHSYIKTNDLLTQYKIPPDVIIALNDEVAIGIVEAYKTAHKALPVVIGYGGSPEIRRYISRGDVLTSIEPDYKIFAEKIIDVIESFFFTYAGVQYPKNKMPTYTAKHIHYIPFHFIE